MTMTEYRYNASLDQLLRDEKSLDASYRMARKGIAWNYEKAAIDYAATMEAADWNFLTGIVDSVTSSAYLGMQVYDLLGGSPKGSAA